MDRTNTVVRRDPQTGRNIGHDLTGMVRGRLEITESTGRRCPHGYTIWRARCQCGNTIERPSYYYVRRRSATSSCGCGPKGRPRIPNGGAHVNALYGHYRQSAKQRGIAFLIGKDFARRLFDSDCTYCGAAPATTYTHSNLSGEYAWNGIDRVDPALGYSAENCVACCKTCNWAKGIMNADEFRAWVKRVHAHLYP